MDNSFSGEYYSPQLVCKVEDKRLGFQGFLVIDTLLGGHCAGGVRMTSTVTEDEVVQLARTMTTKYGFLNIYMGGAKAGITFSNNKSPEERNAVLKTFGERLGFLLRRGIYYPGSDIGTTQEDIELMERGAGIHNVLKQENDNNDSGYFTAVAAVVAAKEMAKYLGIDFNKAKIAVEGFGKVGSSIASEIYSEASVVGISTIRGALYNDKGLNIGNLIEKYKKYGDDIVLTYEYGEKTVLEELLSSDCDILFLSGKPWVLNLGNVHNIKAKVVIGAGNLCFKKGVEDILFQQGIYVFPDFITSCGGVLGLTLRGKGLSLDNIIKLIKDDFAAKINKFIEVSWINHQSPMEVANDIVQRNLYKMRMRENQKIEGRLNQIYSLLRNKKWRSFASKIVLNAIPKHYYHFPEVQEILLYQTREQFISENELAD